MSTASSTSDVLSCVVFVDVTQVPISSVPDNAGSTSVKVDTCSGRHGGISTEVWRRLDGYIRSSLSSHIGESALFSKSNRL